ncbi:MAG: SGNH/GDSL hydrolase family protein [Clostridiales bacterium]|nr:SGNH/GDSL hydrolase family protein [Clostridiales bacterium]
MIKKNSLILFQGDSITDADRNREDNNSLGYGFVNMIASRWEALFPELNTRFINRGISGDRAINLKNRWQEECIDFAPDYVSILIGINESCIRYSYNEITTVDDFRANYRDILVQTREKTGAKIIICEPFLIPVSDEKKVWREDLNPKIDVVRELAREFADVYIPYDGLFAAACCKREPSFWSFDGVHTNQVGNAFLAEHWINSVMSI